MKVLLFGATGMVGQGALRECLLAPDVALVQTVGRTATGIQNPKLREVIHLDMWHYSDVEPELTGFDACFFCLGVSSGGMPEADYKRMTYDLTLAAAETLARLNPGMTFIYVSGAGTDSSEKGRVMWARVKGSTENALLRLPFKATYMFRPGAIQSVNGERSKTPAYRIAYTVARPLFPVLRRLAPRHILTTEQIGRAMLNIARHGAPKAVLESNDIRKRMSRTERFLMSVVLTLIGLYALDYLSLRLQIPSRPQLGAVPMKAYYAVKLKNGKTEVMPGDPGVLTCTNSLFPQIGYAPCWYTRKKNPVQVLN